MKTQVILQGESLAPAVQSVLRGEVVAVPTDTVYGLAADAKNERAVAQIYALKGRPESKPLSVLVSGIADVEALCREIPDSARTLADAFWPGSLTLIMKKAPGIPDVVTAGGDTLGVRCPDSAQTLEIIRNSAPLAAPSANLSGEPSPTTAAAVLAYFDSLIPVVVDGGKCSVGIESTIIDMTVTPLRILRRGALSKRDIKNAIGVNPSGVTILGITGGTGSGKTTALRALEALGATVLDCDAVYHELLGDADMLSEIGARFSGVVSNGVLDRKLLGTIVFSDTAALADLGAITHKYIDREIFKVIRKLEATGGSPVVALDAIALIESGLYKSCDHMTAITAPRETRIARIMGRDGIDYEYAVSRVYAQKPDEFYENACDATLSNDGDEREFFERCKSHFDKIINDLTY